MSTNKRAMTVLNKVVKGPLTFGGYLRSGRTMKDMTQVEMAKYLNISKSTLCDIEKGRQLVSIELAVKLAKQCGLHEGMAVKYAIDDSLRRAGIKLQFELKKTA